MTTALTKLFAIGLLGSVTLAAAPAMAQTSTWDTASFMTAGSKWVAGSRSGSQCLGGFLPITTPINWSGLGGYQTGTIAGNNAIVLLNAGSTAISIPNGPIQPGLALLQPADSLCATLRFTAPFSGTYNLTGLAAAIQKSPTEWTSPNKARVSLIRGTSVLGSALLDLHGQKTWPISNSNVALLAGETLDITVDQVTPTWDDEWMVGLQDAVTVQASIAGTPTGGGGTGNGDGGTANNQIPVLNCSQSPFNPPKINLSTGPSNWQLSLPGGTLGTIAPASNTAWSAVPGATWVGPASAPSTTGVYTYRAKFKLTPCPRGLPAKITIAYRADNSANVLIDGAVIKMQSGTPNYGFLPGSLTTATHTFPIGTGGIHTIALQVTNSGGPTGVAASILVVR